MKQLAIVVPRGENNLSSIVGTYKIFTRANTLFAEQGRPPVFAISLVGEDDQVGFYHDLFTVKLHTTYDRMAHTDLIIIPSLNHHYEQALAENRAVIPWLIQQYKSGASLASICTGAFLLAETGLLTGKSCSTQWSAAAELRTRYPKVDLRTDKLITDEHGIYTNGGAFSFLNFMIYLVEKYYARETAIECAKIFQIDMDRHTQSTFSIFVGHKQHDDAAIQQAQTYLEANYREKISIESLAQSLHLGRRNFDRRFIKATGITPLDYLQRVKIEAAKKALETSRKHIGEVMYEVGYHDMKAFRHVFQRITGVSPLAYKAKYNREGV